MGNSVDLMQKRWLSYKHAKMVLHDARHKPNTRKEYYDWWMTNEPVGIPKHPQRVYLREWTSWNDWLDNENEFVIREVGQWMPYWDAMRYVHGRKFINKPAYKEAVLEADWPNIPKCPQVVYEEWIDWSTWLGVTLRSRMNVMTELRVPMALCTMANLSANVIKVIVARGGMEELKETLEEAGTLKVFKMYEWDASLSDEVAVLFDHFASDQEGGEYIVHNMPSLTFELDSLLLMWRV